MVDREPGTPPAGFGQACSAVARAIADSLSLDDVLARIAAAARMRISFDTMGIWHSKTPDDPVNLIRGPGAPEPRRPTDRPLRRDDISPGLWPVDGAPVCIADAAQAMDPAYPGDRLLVELGFRSILALSLRSAEREIGILWFVHKETGRYVPGDATALQSVIDLATLAIEHDHLQALTQERRRKQEALSALLPTLARALDVQAVFAQVSEVTQGVLPHDYLTLGLVNDEGGLTFHASSLGDAMRARSYRPRSDFGAASLEWDYYLVREYTVLASDAVQVRYWDPATRRLATHQFDPGPELLGAYTDRGVRSELRVPIRLQGERVGNLFFCSRRPNAYAEEDAELARRVADHVALAIAHERLAGEARRAAQAQARAAELQERVDALVEELEGMSPHRAHGRSRKWRDVLAHATKVAETDTTVLITGESGTGKEVVARYIHRASHRRGRPFVALNCAALPEQLLESELFGYERGAFTGAHAARAGRIEQALGGVLFLDEVAEMSPPVQAKFLRVLQEREFQRLGGSATLKADVRVIAATNRDPRVAMERGTLREDLYYRLGVFEIVLPPLRERPEDVMVLAETFLEEIGRSIGRPAGGLSKDARDRLLAHRWPGNVRELRNALERAVILCEGGLITGEHLPFAVAGASASSAAAGRAPGGAGSAPSTAPAETGAATAGPGAPAIPPEGMSLDEVERDLIQRAMAQAGNNKSEAARLLGLARGQLYSKLRRHGLTRAKR